MPHFPLFKIDRQWIFWIFSLCVIVATRYFTKYNTFGATHVKNVKILTRLIVFNENKQNGEDKECNQRRLPWQHKHNRNAQNRAEEWQPPVIELKPGPKTRRFRCRRIKTRKIGNSKSGQKEISDQWSDYVQITNEYHRRGDEKCKKIGAKRIIIRSMTFSKHLNQWEKFVLAKSLNE